MHTVAAPLVEIVFGWSTLGNAPWENRVPSKSVIATTCSEASFKDKKPGAISDNLFPGRNITPGGLNSSQPITQTASESDLITGKISNIIGPRKNR